MGVSIEEELKEREKTFEKKDEELKKLKRKLQITSTPSPSKSIIAEAKDELHGALNDLKLQQEELTSQMASLEEQQQEGEKQLLTKMQQFFELTQQMDALNTKKERIEDIAGRWERVTADGRQVAIQTLIAEIDKSSQIMAEIAEESDRMLEEDLQRLMKSSELPPDTADASEALRRAGLARDHLDLTLSGWRMFQEEVAMEEAYAVEELAILTNLDAEIKHLPEIEAELRQLSDREIQMDEEIQKLEAELINIDSMLNKTAFEELMVGERIADREFMLDYVEAGIIPLDLIDAEEMEPDEEEIELSGEISEEFEEFDAQAETEEAGGIFIEVGAKAMEILGKRGFMAGGRIALIKNHRFSVGAGGYTVVSDFEVPGERSAGVTFEESHLEDIPPEEFEGMFLETSRILDMSYGGLVLEYVLLPHSPIHLSLNALIGVGLLDYRDDESELPGFDFEDMNRFWIAEPGVNLILKPTKHSRIALGVSYRFVRDVDLIGLEDKDLSKPSVSLGFRFGWF